MFSAGLFGGLFKRGAKDQAKTIKQGTPQPPKDSTARPTSRPQGNLMSYPGLQHYAPKG